MKGELSASGKVVQAMDDRLMRLRIVHGRESITAWRRLRGSPVFEKRILARRLGVYTPSDVLLLSAKRRAISESGRSHRWWTGFRPGLRMQRQDDVVIAVGQGPVQTQ